MHVKRSALRHFQLESQSMSHVDPQSQLLLPLKACGNLADVCAVNDIHEMARCRQHALITNSMHVADQYYCYLVEKSAVTCDLHATACLPELQQEGFACQRNGSVLTFVSRCGVDSMKEDARKMVLTMVDMERSYLTADVFRDIISQNGATDGVDQPGMLRTLSGDPCWILHWQKSVCHWY